MPIKSYNPAVFITSLGSQATQIVVNDLSTIKTADSVNILGNDYLVANIETESKTITLDKDRNSNIDLVSTPTIEIKQNAPDDDVSLSNPTPISDNDRKDKIISLGKDYYQRKINKAQEVFGADYYALKPFLETEVRAYLGSFNADMCPILSILSSVDSKNIDTTTTEYKKKLVEFDNAQSLLRTQYVNLSIKVKQAQSKEELDLIIFA